MQQLALGHGAVADRVLPCEAHHTAAPPRTEGESRIADTCKNNNNSSMKQFQPADIVVTVWAIGLMAR